MPPPSHQDLSLSWAGTHRPRAHIRTLSPQMVSTTQSTMQSCERGYF